MRVRVVEKPDGSVRVIPSAPNSIHGEQGAIDRTIKKLGLEGLPYEDMNESELPTRKDRDCWELDKQNKKIKINQAKKQAREQEKQEKENKIMALKQKLNLTDEDFVLLKT